MKEPHVDASGTLVIAAMLVGIEYQIKVFPVLLLLCFTFWGCFDPSIIAAAGNARYLAHFKDG